jgi:hypothetical protein
MREEYQIKSSLTPFFPFFTIFRIFRFAESGFLKYPGHFSLSL